MIISSYRKNKVTIKMRQKEFFFFFVTKLIKDKRKEYKKRKKRELGPTEEDS